MMKRVLRLRSFLLHFCVTLRVLQGLFISMRSLGVVVALCGAGLILDAQNPVVDPRGVTNVFSQAPAPATAARGGIVQITGLNLGPSPVLTASTIPLPTSLGDPPVQVLINGIAAPLFSVSANKIVAQVPVDAATDMAELSVRRGGTDSRAARFTINAIDPVVRSADDSGYGAVLGDISEQSLRISASGLGPADISINSGDAGPADAPAKPKANIQAFVGGRRTKASAALSSTLPGVFDVSIDLPAAARAGDLVNLVIGNRAANRTVYQTMALPEAQFLPVPDGAADIRELTDADLNGNFLIATGARDSSGCYPAYRFDFVKRSASKIDGCLTAANNNAPSPIVKSNEAETLAALVGPPLGNFPNAVSSKALIFNPAQDNAIAADLPSAASLLAGAVEANFAAILPGTPTQAVSIDGQSGAVMPGASLNIGNAGGAGGGALTGVGLNLNVDGLTKILVSRAVGNRIAVVVADDDNQPKRAKFAMVSQSGVVAGSADFPAGWLPLLAAQRPAAAGGGGAPVGIAQARGSAAVDSVKDVFYVLAKLGDNSKHGLIAFPLNASSPAAIPFPNGWFAPACAPVIRIFELILSRTLTLFGTNAPETEFKAACPAIGYIQLDLATQKSSAIPLSGGGPFNASSGNMLNDYLYATNIDASARGGTSDTLFVLDGVSGTPFQLSAPSGIGGFVLANRIADASSLTAVGANRTPGDAGLIVFNLDQGSASILPTPDGFASITEVGVFLATRKVVARGIKAGNLGSQLLIYDLNTGNVTPVPNPNGVTSVGPPARQQGSPGQMGPGPGGAGGGALLTANPKANTVAAIGFSGDGKQAGVIVVRIP